MKELFDKLYNKSEESFYKILDKNLKENKKTFIVTANPETFMMSEKDTEMRDLLLDKDTIWVLDKIYKYNRIGRRSLALIAEKENKDLGEGKIRTLLSNLQKESFIKINKGKKGTEILEKGIEMLKSQN